MKMKSNYPLTALLLLIIMGNGESILQSFINIQIEKQQLSFKVQSPY